ncbi:MAG TPA: PilZ domain-containing protein [Candidatus Saccharimonadales bacterium]|nr:PilZ domain-containing protein [Candidatus Saccharimonadales bacterium]
MSATNRAVAWENLPPQTDSPAAAAKPVVVPDVPAAPRVPTLRVMPLLRNPQPNRFVRVPTHAVGVHTEQRERPRAALKLPLKLRSVEGVLEEFPITLVTRDISSSGVYFLSPKPLAAGTAIELDIVLVSRPLGYGNVVVSSKAHVRRIEPANMPGWYGIAASFDDFAFDRDDQIPGWFPVVD